MGVYNPPKKNSSFLARVAVEDYANPGNFKTNPTIAAGDWKVSVDGGSFTSLATLPSTSPSGSTLILLTLSAGEMNGDVITVMGQDQTNPKEWSDLCFTILTT